VYGRRDPGNPVGMLSVLRSKLTFSNAVAVLALFVALGGSSYAALRVGSREIVNNSVRSADLRNNDVRSRDIRNGEVRSADLRNNGIRGRDIHDGAVASADLQDNAITSRDIRDGSIVGGDVAPDTLTGTNVLESSLGTVPSATNAGTLDGRSAAAFLSADRLVTTGFEKLSIGQTRAIARSGPFTWSATCADAGGGSTQLTVTLESTEAGAFTASFDGAGGAVSPGSPATVFQNASSTPVFGIGFPATAVAPSGAAPSGLGFVAIDVVGADCGVKISLTP
jgi:hypothetical protein